MKVCMKMEHKQAYTYVCRYIHICIYIYIYIYIYICVCVCVYIHRIIQHCSYVKSTYLLAYSLLLEKLTGPQLDGKFAAFYGTRRFIAAFTIARHLSLFWARSIQSITPSHFLNVHFNVIPASMPGSPSNLFPSGFPTKTLYTSLLTPMHAKCPAHRILLDLITRIIIGEEYRSLISWLCSFAHSSVISLSVSFS